MTAMTFAFGGVAAWMPTYLYEREATYALTPSAYEAAAQPTEPPDRRRCRTNVLDRLRPLDGQEFRSTRAAAGRTGPRTWRPRTVIAGPGSRDAARDDRVGHRSAT